MLLKTSNGDQQELGSGGKGTCYYKPGHLNSILRRHRKVERENQLHRVGLQPPLALCGTHTHPSVNLTNVRLKIGTQLYHQRF